MHACIELDMDGEVGDTLLLCCMNQLFEQVETEHLWFEPIVEEHLERGRFRIHNHDVGCNASLTQIRSFISHSHSEIIHAVVL